MVIAILVWLVIGGIIGWLASIVMSAKKGSLLRYIICGILGSIVGGFVHDLTGIGSGPVLSIADITDISVIGLLFAIGGACVIIIIARILKI